jgi:anaerobic magnesium-protoporphyrin IX monomethyl ester cyclase
LAGWAKVDLGCNNLPWLQGEAFARLQRSIRYFLLDNQLNRTRRQSRSQTLRSALNLARKPLHWRLRHAFFDWPFELWLSKANERLVMRRSLLTGQPLTRELAKPA